MTEQQYLESLRSHWPREHESAEPTEQTMLLSEQSVSAFPASAELWVIRGCLLQLAEVNGYPLEESAACFRRAIELQPQNPDAYRELGHFLDAVMANPRKAKQYFNKVRLLERAKDRRNARGQPPLAGDAQS